jgi:hypothetical protein
MGRFVLLLQLAWNAENSRGNDFVIYPEAVARAERLIN